MKRTEFQEEAEKYREAESLRRLAFCGIFVATCSILIGIIAVPSLYSYLQKVQATLEEEALYCKSATNTLWKQLAHAQVAKGVIRPDFLENSSSLEDLMQKQRSKRQAGYDAPVNNFGAQATAFAPATQFQTIAQTCSCRIGPAGLAGPPGVDGIDGQDGAPGNDGNAGSDAAPDAVPTAADFCFNCPPGPAGPPGNPGPKGPNGNPGSAGQPGSSGNPGQAGPMGPPGPAGQNGAPGNAGQSGQPGVVNDVPGIPGPPGLAGPAGQPGPNGQPGNNGNPGQPGPNGPPGDAGAPGQRGQDGQNGENGPDGEQGSGGDCSYCPPPRTAPGY